MVPEVRVRHRPLAAEVYGARDGVRPLQPGMLLPLQGHGRHGRQRHEVRF